MVHFPAFGYIYYLRCLNTFKILYVGSSADSYVSRMNHMIHVKKSTDPFCKKIRHLQQKYKINTPVFMQIKQYRLFKYRSIMHALERFHVRKLLKKGIKLYNVKHSYMKYKNQNTLEPSII